MILPTTFEVGITMKELKVVQNLRFLHKVIVTHSLIMPYICLKCLAIMVENPLFKKNLCKYARFRLTLPYFAIPCMSTRLRDGLSFSATQNFRNFKFSHSAISH